MRGLRHRSPRFRGEPHWLPNERLLDEGKKTRTAACPRGRSWACPRLADIGDVRVGSREGCADGEAGGGAEGEPARPALVDTVVQGRGRGLGAARGSDAARDLPRAGLERGRCPPRGPAGGGRREGPGGEATEEREELRRGRREVRVLRDEEDISKRAATCFARRACAGAAARRWVRTTTQEPTPPAIPILRVGSSQARLLKSCGSATSPPSRRGSAGSTR